MVWSAIEEEEEEEEEGAFRKNIKINYISGMSLRE
jgi:hypothetical protein